MKMEWNGYVNIFYNRLSVQEWVQNARYTLQHLNTQTEEPADNILALLVFHFRINNITINEWACQRCNVPKR